MRRRAGREPGFRVGTIEAMGRLSIPSEYVTQLKWLAGEEDLQAWLLILGQGRSLLLSTAEVQAADQLQTLAEVILNPTQPDEGREPFDADPSEIAALATILVPVTISPKRGGWRLELPREIRQLPQGYTDSQVVFLWWRGHLEIWSPSVLAEAQRMAWKHIESWRP